MKKRIHVIGICLFLMCVLSLSGQDIHYTQFSNGSAVLNPALTGIFEGDARIYGHYRNQWRKVGAYEGTYTFYYDTKLRAKEDAKWYPALGFNINYDKAGFSKLSTFNAAINGSISTFISDTWIATLGGNIGLINRSYDTQALTFGSQYNNVLGAYDPTMPTGEDFSDMNFAILDLGAGVNLRYQHPNKRTKFDVGLGTFHLNQGKQQFKIGQNDIDPEYPIRYSFYFDAYVKVLEKLDLEFRTNLQRQLSYQENVFGMGVRVIGSEKPRDNWAFHIGGFGRLFYNEYLGDAIAPYLRVDYNALSIGVTYDVNVSPLSQVTNREGGFEVWAQYRFNKIRGIGEFKTCKIF